MEYTFIHNLDSFPLMGRQYVEEDYINIDLSVNNTQLTSPIHQADLTEYINNYKLKEGATFAYGGYAEKRALYQSNLFIGQKVRDVHLAIDIWHDIDTPIYAPIGGKVYSLQFNNADLDYGYTIMMEHFENNQIFYTLMGHLSPSIMTLWKEGDTVQKGDLIGHLGDIKDNGGWSPHVHFQIIIDLQGNKGDYPGVCSEENKAFYLNNCPNPMQLILPIYA